MIIISGCRLRLRDWKLEDLGSFEQWMQPQHKWHEYDGPYFPDATPQEVEKMASMLRERVLNSNFPSPRRSMVIADVATDNIIGSVSWYWESEETNWLSVGLNIYDPANWSQGLGYEALGLWSDYLLHENNKLARLDLRTWSGNVGMMRLAEKLGYKLEARFRKARIVKGEYFDGMGYGVLREEWKEMYPEGFEKHLLSR